MQVRANALQNILPVANVVDAGKVEESLLNVKVTIESNLLWHKADHMTQLGATRFHLTPENTDASFILP